MAIHGVDPKCYILALFVRDDKQRFLLGDDPFEFKDKQLHFQPNVVANDVVEVQGNDGVLLAGQVRRAGTQEFDGYVGNGTTSKAEVEVKRREFLQFFRKNHFYKVIYVFPDGSAIQRKQGFLVDDPTVEELYQQYPAYHVALNFQDVNYYTYSEDDEGEEIYSEEAIIKLVGGGATGGLIWDSYGVVWEEPWSDEAEAEGTEIQVNNNNPAKARIDLENVYGDTYQQTYSGKNKFNINGSIYNNPRASYTISDQKITVTSVNGGVGYVSIAIPNSSELLGQSGNMSFGNIVVSSSASDVKSQARLMQAKSSSLSSVTGEFALVRATGATDKSFTFPSSFNSGYDTFALVLYPNNRSSEAVEGEYCEYSNIQIELGSSATSYEPYVGGTPSPNPDYPQNVNVVTGRQLVTISDGGSQSQEHEVNLGKNLFDVSTIAENTGASTNGTEDHTVTYSSNNGRAVMLLKVKPNSTYALSIGDTNIVNQIYFVGMKNTTQESGHSFGWKTSGAVLQTDIKDEYVLGVISAPNNGGNIANITNAKIQIEQGSTATSYSPYFTPIELCKIGKYQDYIYRSGDDWYIHKGVVKNILDGSSTVNSVNTGLTTVARVSVIGTDLGASTDGIISNRFITKAGWNNDEELCYKATASSTIFLFINKSRGVSNTTTASNWLSNNPVIAYYTLATPTDTQITNQALIDQLDALDSSWLFIGQNNILVSASSPNLPAPIKFSYMTKYAPLGAEWEEGGTKGPTIVDVNAIDNTYPVWELTGPSVNPTISVITTNTTLTYVGTITASQKLEIDMLNKTATLNGTSVIGNVSGDWVYMAPGTNRISYTAGNTDAPDSTLYWQEVVG